MSNSHWDHFFFHDDFGVIRSKINFFLGARYALWSLRGGGMCPFCPTLGPALRLVQNIIQFSTQFRTGYTSESVVIYMNASGCIS